MACRFCARRRKASELQVPLLQAQDVSRLPTAGLRDLSEEVLASIFRCLRATEALSSLVPAAKFLRSVLDDPGSSSWTAFLQQEFPGGAGGGREDYEQLVRRRAARSVEWRPVPLGRSPGQREGSPGVFVKGGHVFVFGGWGLGPMRDLQVAVLRAPLEFREVQIRGVGPHPTYEAKVTLLDEEEEIFRVLVTGGWRHGGYYEESGMYGVMEIELGEQISAQWCKTGSMVPRANHSATLVPASVAGALYPKGYVLIFGGCTEGSSSNSLSLLDLSNFTWSEGLEVEGQGPEPQNSHSATLLPCAPRGFCTSSTSTTSPTSTWGLLFLGGGCGDENNGGPPRGGSDFGAWWLDLEPNAWHWASGAAGARPPRWQRFPGPGGRGHVAMRLARTDTVVMFGGGKPPLQKLRAVNCELGVKEVEQVVKPKARAFGGGCALPNGLVLIYGGWHPCRGTYSDFWVGSFDSLGRDSEFFQSLPVTEPEEEDEEMAFNLVVQRLFGRSRAPMYEDDDHEEEEDEGAPGAPEEVNSSDECEDLQDFLNDVNSDSETEFLQSSSECED